MKSITLEQPATTTTQPQFSEPTLLTTSPRTSAAIRRLMDEVRFEESDGSSAAIGYDRAHNRHNRS